MKTMYSAAGSAMNNTKFLYQNKLEDKEGASLVEAVGDKTEEVSQEVVVAQMKSASEYLDPQALKDLAKELFEMGQVRGRETNEGAVAEIISIIDEIEEKYIDNDYWNVDQKHDIKKEIKYLKERLNEYSGDLTSTLRDAAERWYKDTYHNIDKNITDEELIKLYKKGIDNVPNGGYSRVKDNARKLYDVFSRVLPKEEKIEE